MNDFLMKHGNEIKTIVYAVFIYLHIDADIVRTLMLLMVIDTCSGMVKSYALGIPISFKILFFGLITKVLILLIPMTLALVGLGLKYDFTPLVDVVLRVLVVAEGWSIVTNIYVTRTKKPVEDLDVISMLLSAIRKGLMKIIKVFLVKIENPEDLFNEKKDKTE